MAKFRKYKPKPIKEPYVSKKKDRRQKRIKRHEAKSKVKALTSQTHLEPIPRNQTVENATKLNKALDYASDKFGNRNDYSKYLIPLLKNLDPKFDMKKPKPGDYNGFKISDDYDGNPNNLFKYTDFETIPTDDPTVEAYMQQILDLDWSSPENYEKHMADINKSIYESNVASLGVAPGSQFFMILETVMQSSSAWRIAARNADDSDQVKANWELLYTTGATALSEKDTSIYDTFVQMVFNGDDLDNIVDKIDEMIYKAVKG